MTLGSLFSGSGGFELAGMLAGIKPVFNSEIEPFPILVTSKRLPDVKHYGDVSKLKGSELEPVDIITFGFPCQSVSIAGRREGLKHIEHGDDVTTRTGLFYEAIRIIKEMRNANGYPRYALAENVWSITSSRNGEDFRIVLEEMCRVKDEKISIPKAKWLHAGSILGDDFSLAWRMLDAQYFSVPQRRQRVFLVADFDGQRAEEILFECKSMSGHTQESCSSEQSTAGSPEESTGETVYCLNPQGSSGVTVTENQVATLIAQDHGNHPVVVGFDRYNSQPTGDLAHTLSTGGGNNMPMVAYGISKEAFTAGEKANFNFNIAENLSPTLQASGPGAVFDVRFTSEGSKVVRGNCYETDTVRTLDTGGGNPDSNHGGVAICMTTGNFLSATEETANPLLARDYKDPQIVSSDCTVRRLTPTECARLQGFPSDWCSDLAIPEPSPEELAFWKNVWDEWDTINSKKLKTENQIRKWLANPTTDAKMYKLWGNGIALPVVYYILKQI